MNAREVEELVEHLTSVMSNATDAERWQFEGSAENGEFGCAISDAASDYGYALDEATTQRVLQFARESDIDGPGILASLERHGRILASD